MRAVLFCKVNKTTIKGKKMAQELNKSLFLLCNGNYEKIQNSSILRYPARFGVAWCYLMQT